MHTTDFALIPVGFVWTILIPWGISLVAVAWFAITLGFIGLAHDSKRDGELPSSRDPRSERPAVAEPEPVEEPAPALPALAHLRVIASHGTCRGGYKVGDHFTCTPEGEISPPICAVAKRALKPLLIDMVAHEPGVPRQVTCPIYDHSLVFELNGKTADADSPLEEVKMAGAA